MFAIWWTLKSFKFLTWSSRSSEMSAAAAAATVPPPHPVVAEGNREHVVNVNYVVSIVMEDVAKDVKEDDFFYEVLSSYDGITFYVIIFNVKGVIYRIIINAGEDVKEDDIFHAAEIIKNNITKGGEEGVAEGVAEGDAKGDTADAKPS